MLNVGGVAGRGGDTVISSMGDILLRTIGSHKAYYNGTEIGAGGGGGVTSFASRTGAVSPWESDYAPWFLKLTGGTLNGILTMMAAIDMNGNAINSLPLGRDWSSLEILDGSALCRDDIDGPSGMLNTEFLLNGKMDAGIGTIILPHFNDIPANCVVGQVIWEPDDGRLWIGKDTNVWKEIGGGTPATVVTDETTFGLAAAVGTSTKYAREDHTHGSPVHDKAVHDALGINADTLDTYHSASFLFLTGGTLSGDLNFYSPSVIPQLLFKDTGNNNRGQIRPYGSDFVINAIQGYLYLSGASGVKMDNPISIGDLSPNTTNTYKLGTSSYYWNYAYIKNIYMNDGVLDFRTDNVHRISYISGTNSLDIQSYQQINLKTTADSNVPLSAAYNGIRLQEALFLRKNHAADNCYIVDDANGTMELHVPTGQKVKVVVG
jgi:hypothetical protein